MQPSDQVIAVSKQIKPRLESTSSALKQIQSILAESIEQEEIMNNLVQRLQGAISNEQDEE